MLQSSFLSVYFKMHISTYFKHVKVNDFHFFTTYVIEWTLNNNFSKGKCQFLLLFL